MTKYKSVRMPFEAWENFKRRKEEMERELTRLKGGQKISIPLTNILVESSKRPIFFMDDLHKLSERSWKKLR